MKKWQKFLVWVGVIIALIILISYLLPKSYKVERSISIKSSPEVIYMLTSDFRLWHVWAPWTKETDSTAVFTVSGEPGKPGAKWSWEGKVFGQGEMTFIEGIPGKLVSYDLAFDQGKYLSKGRFEIETGGDSCKVIWIDEGDLGYNPINRYFGLLMESMMGPDFDKGLAKLKDVAEARADWPVIEETTWPPHTFLAITDSAGPASYSAVLGKAFGELMTQAQSQKYNITGAPFAIYLKWDSVTMFSVMDIGIPVQQAEKASGRVRVVNFPEQKVVKVNYFGPYDKTAPMYYILDQYVKETGLENAGSPWEIYVTDPMMEKDTAKWQTVIAFPVK